ncbi:MAG: hypothetical protein ACJAUP_002613 [Cellvibrionaceae bacterium]|jgi:hypothetical protein
MNANHISQLSDKTFLEGVLYALDERLLLLIIKGSVAKIFKGRNALITQPQLSCYGHKWFMSREKVIYELALANHICLGFLVV